MDLRGEYSELKPFLDKCAKLIEEFLSTYIPAETLIDRISARAKSVDRFMEKAKKVQGGAPKYERPLLDIQDIVGARVVVLYPSEVEKLKRFIPSLLPIIERRGLEPEGFSEFGYVGWHAIARIPSEAIPQSCPLTFPSFFEIQIKTVFQHAWAEAEHDLAYKEQRGPLTRDDHRLVAFAAAQAWGADNSFEAVLRALSDRRAQEIQAEAFASDSAALTHQEGGLRGPRDLSGDAD